MRKYPLFEIYEAKDGWRWRLIARNGKIIADSGQSYRYQPRDYMIEWLGSALSTAKIRVTKREGGE